MFQKLRIGDALTDDSMLCIVKYQTFLQDKIWWQLWLCMPLYDVLLLYLKIEIYCYSEVKTSQIGAFLPKFKNVNFLFPESFASEA